MKLKNMTTLVIPTSGSDPRTNIMIAHAPDVMTSIGAAYLNERLSKLIFSRDIVGFINDTVTGKNVNDKPIHYAFDMDSSAPLEQPCYVFDLTQYGRISFAVDYSFTLLDPRFFSYLAGKNFGNAGIKVTRKKNILKLLVKTSIEDIRKEFQDAVEFFDLMSGVSDKKFEKALHHSLFNAVLRVPMNDAEQCLRMVLRYSKDPESDIKWFNELIDRVDERVRKVGR